MIRKISDKIFTLLLRILSFDRYAYMNKSFSQEGEDLFLIRYFRAQKVGFYIDVGAHHPKKFSNTYSLYLKGWHGINIDAMPGVKSTFNRNRRRDINIESGVSLRVGNLDYYQFTTSAVNTFSKEEADLKITKKGYKLKSIISISTQPLRSILKKNMPKEQLIDFMSIDVEGLELDVIDSNDWEKYRPKLVLIEDLNISSIEETLTSPLGKKMTSLSYKPISKLFFTIIFEDERKR